MKETVTLNTQEQKRMMVLNRLLVGQLTVTEAAVLLCLSERQVRRLCAAYRKEGAAVLAHGNRGRKPVRTISEEDAIPSVGSSALCVLSLQPVFVEDNGRNYFSLQHIIYEVLFLLYASVHLRWF